MSLYTTASILVLICLLSVGTCFWDYDDSHTLSCLNVDSNLSFTEQTQSLWNIIILHEFDTYLFLICSPVILLIQLIFIINFLKNKVLLVRPSDIFFVILVSDVFANLHYFSTAMFYVTNSTSDDMPASFVPFCIINAIVITFVNSVLICCLFMFFFYIIYALRKNALKQSSFWFKYPPYIVILIVSISVCNLLWFQDFLGLNNTGLCGITMNRRGDFSTLSIPIVQFIMDLVFLILGIYTWAFFKKHMPKTQGLRRRSYQMNASIGIYLFGFTLINFVFTVYDILIFCNCYISSPISGLTILASFENFTRIIESVFIICFILLNRRFRRKLLKMFRSLFQKKQKLQKSKSIELEHFFTNQLDLGLDDRIIELIQQQNRIDLFKIAQIITVISGVKISQKQYMKELTFNALKKIYFCQTITFKVGSKILNDYDVQSQFLPRVGMLDGTITLHCPRVFKRFLSNDNLINVEKSFDLLKNYQKMYNLVEGQGGKSGQFFFFTFDNQYVLKTVTKYQFEFLLSHIQHFARHFQQNPNSLLAKIYGLYTITTDQFEKKIHLILMKNLIGRPKQRILRTYDIKGSKYDRQVIKPERHYKFNEIRKLTLKDTDFMKLQGKLLIDPALVRPLRQIVKQDTLFLKSLNLIDYSLLVVKLYDPDDNQLQQQQHLLQKNKRITTNTDSISNKELLQNILEMIKETMQLNQSQQQESSFEKLEAQPAKQFHKFQRMHSTDAPYQYYHIGIIDYMQKWDLQKKGEKWWKTLSGKKDVSAQQPNVYQKRFLNFIQQITMTDNASIFSEDGNFEVQNSLSSPKFGKSLKQHSLKDELISSARADKL